jgi:hypothetical protein
MHVAEVDYDLTAIRTWRVYEPAGPGQVRYFCYELAQTDPRMPEERYFKALRLICLTRVAHHLRNNGGGGEVFGAMRDVLDGLREKRVLLINMIAKSRASRSCSPTAPRTTGDPLNEATANADDAYALSVALDGTYQQLEYQPPSLTVGETCRAYHAEWNLITMARGRPMPQGVALGSSGILRRQPTRHGEHQQQLESFVRGWANPLSARHFPVHHLPYAAGTVPGQP